MKEDFLESLPFFTSRLSAIVMERGNVLVIGTFFSYDMVAIYDLCAKIVSILKNSIFISSTSYISKCS